MKTHKIDSGKALELAQQIDAKKTETTQALRGLAEQGVALKAQARKETNDLLHQLCAEVGVQPDDTKGLDLSYLTEHGVAYLAEGTEDDDCTCGDTLASMIEKAVTGAVEH